MSVNWSDFKKLVSDRPVAASKEPVRVGMLVQQGSPARPTVHLRADVMMRFCKAGDKASGDIPALFDVFIGSASETRHLLSIGANPEGTFKPTEFGKAKGSLVYRFTLPWSEKYPRCKIVPGGCAYEWRNDRLLITLPSWLWDERRAREIEKRAPL